jgi:uncharacterized GH25 family protein
MKLLSFASACVALVLLATAAQAHFVWVFTAADSTGKVVPHISFGEGTGPSEADLLDNVKQTKAWIQKPGQKPQALTLAKQTSGDEGSWVADVDAKGAVIFATCDYGVIERGGKALLLQYYAKKLDATPEQLKTLGRTEELPLDVVPTLEGDECKLTILWQGKPAANSEVTIEKKGGKAEKVAADAEGRVSFKTSGAGEYAIRARHIEADQTGECDGKAYISASHYSTLTLVVQ